ncbi:LysR family transcriptional regulator [Geovibrio ferrireducens]|uniref:LysR family transcriptional regulator n=1 Tax=Geovibrio ferrireducens TaxID=46201 RepID=UPI0022459063|nr:LysR family transcriptional regulator [Geovibrio ferrireducens]
MDLNELKIFLEVYRTGTISSAAEKLNTVQSNVTARLKKLEDELNVSLFYRKSRGVEITSDGKRLLPYAKKIMSAAAEINTEFKLKPMWKGEVRIGLTDTTFAECLPTAMAAYKKKYPQVELTIKTDASSALVDDIIGYRLDGAFTGSVGGNENIESVHICKIPAVLGGTKKEIESPSAMIVFKKGCSYRDVAEKWALSSGKQNVKIIELSTLDGILGCVNAGLGITCLPEKIMRRYNVPFREMEEDFSLVETNYIYRRDIKPSAAADAFAALLRKNFLTETG